MTKLSDNDIQQIIKLYQDKTSILDIAKEYQVSQWTIYYRLKKKYVQTFKIGIKRRKIQTEIRLCDCIGQQCKGRFLVRTDKSFTVCPYEAVRIGLINCISEYYK